MESNGSQEIIKKFFTGFGLVCLLGGTGIALVGLYLKGMMVAIAGFAFIAIGIIVMEYLHRRA